MEHFRKLERMYLNANFNTHIYHTTTIGVLDGEARISMEVDEKYFHALGAIHGSVYFKLLDDAAFFAVNSLVDDVFVLTTSFNLNILKPVNTGSLTAIGKIKFKSRNLFAAESVILNSANEEVAFGIGNFMKSKIKLSERIGYK